MNQLARLFVLILLINFTMSEQCGAGSPCGWIVYKYIGERKIFDYTIKLNCKCAPDQICVQQEENLSLRAFVYRCMPQ